MMFDRNHMRYFRSSLVRLAEALQDVPPSRPSAAPGWTVGDQLGHLTWSDRHAVLALEDTAAFQAAAPDLSEGFDSACTATARSTAAEIGDDPWSAWSESFNTLWDLLESTRQDRRVPWFGPTMSRDSFVRARLMETWAHLLDIADPWVPGAPVADDWVCAEVLKLGFAARRYAFTINGVDTETVGSLALHATLSDGCTLSFGPVEATSHVRGPLVVLARSVVHREIPGTDPVVVDGAAAHVWTRCQQAFAGPPGTRERRLNLKGDEHHGN